jgi:hypothetical protein
MSTTWGVQPLHGLDRRRTIAGLPYDPILSSGWQQDLQGVEKNRVVVNQEDFQAAHGEGKPRRASAPGSESPPGCKFGVRSRGLDSLLANISTERQ